MFTRKEVAKELKISLASVVRYIYAGKIKAVKIGRDWRVSEEELERIKSEGI